MATDALTSQQVAQAAAERRGRARAQEPLLVTLLMPLASLKLTVALFAMAIFLIFAGTLAQVDKDIWEVMNQYFRAFVARIDLQIFFPPAFFSGPAPKVPGWFWFPGGYTLGGLMGINLLAAHALRFKVQASGPRLLAGLAVIAVGIVLTAMVIAGGSGKDTIEGAAPFDWSVLWTAMKWSLVALWGAGAYGLYKLDRTRKYERWGLGASEALLGAMLVWIFWQGDSATLGDSSMRILWQLIKGGLAGLVLLAGCALVFRKRAGVVLLHAGIALVMVNELVVAGLHVEGLMNIREGETINYVQDIRTVELAVVDPANEKTDDVVVVPRQRLKVDELIAHEYLPFDVQVTRYLQNSELRAVKPSDKNPATAGLGLRMIAEEAKAGAGADAGGKVDATAAYVKLFSKGTQELLGAYLVGIGLPPQKVAVGDKSYDLELRFKRNYKPYSLKLYDVRFDKYLGTQTAKNYSSDLRLVDASRNVDREVKIWMNNPLRFAGETFYQSGVSPEGTVPEYTTLQVVTNTGWMIPYVACMLVGTGMLAHFSLTLTRFLRRRKEEEAGVTPSRGTQPGAKAAKAALRRQPAGTFARAFPWVIVALAVLAILNWARAPQTPLDQMQLAEFGRLPVVYEGRVKPLDSVARNMLRVVSNKQTFLDESGAKPVRSQPAIKWLLDVIVQPEIAFKHKVFRIENTELLDTLHLKRREGLRYAPEEFWDHVGELERQAQLASKTKASELSVYQKKVRELVDHLQLFVMLNTAFKVPPIRTDAEHIREDWQRAQEQLAMLKRMQPPLVVPPASGDAEWEPFATSVITNIKAEAAREKPNPATMSLATLMFAYRKGDAKLFNQTLAEYQNWLAENPPDDLNSRKVDFETFFNHFEPFWNAAVLYLLAFVLLAFGWLGWTTPLNRAAFWLVVVTLALHTFAIVGRIYISGRPPVTNLYSSAVFIGWGAVVLGIVIELVYKIGIGTMVAAVAGFATLLIAHFLAANGDTFSVLVAVLDTQFWLATHVTCVTLGYSTTFMAGLLGVIYILRGVLTPSLSQNVSNDLTRMIYGTLCFATFFSFIGTVLGGLWADDSWGRFWGWDPKENGALMIVLWNALVLHARWGGMVKQRGLATLSVVGNIVTAWSWFGVNELGVGLHSYGFTEGVLLALGGFIATQLLIIALGLLPKHLWWSFRGASA